jgi:hypothetical protein
MKWVFTGLVVATLACVGCGGGNALPDGAKTGAEQAAQQSLEQIKAKLRPIVETGVVGASSLYGLDKSFKAAGKDALIPELEKLMRAKPAQAKEIATKLLEQL